MKALFDAIFAKLSGSALSTAIGGRLHFTIAPQGGTLPFVVYEMVSGVPEWTFTEEMESVRVQFTIISDASSAIEAENIYGNLTALYDDCALTITGYKAIWMQRTFQHLTREGDGAGTAWQYVVEYHIYMEKN